MIRISPVVRSIVERKSARSFFKQPKPLTMFGLFNPKRNADLLLLSEALAETRSELNQLRREYEFLHSSYNDFRNTFLNLEIPEQLEQLKLNI